jgi:hypothetical protein
MANRTTPESSIKCAKRPLTWVRACVDAFTRALFDTSDATAQRHGWQITPIHHGFGRLYRDPRFDTIALCPTCHGHQADETKCLRCLGSGRIVINPDTQPSSDLPPGRRP